MAAKAYSFESIWNVVSSLAVQGTSELYMHSIGHGVEAGALMAAANATGQFAVLVPLLGDEAFADQSGDRAIRVTRTLVDGAPYACVTCADPDLNDVFIIFVRDLVQRLPAVGPGAGVLIEHVEHWRDLFAETKSSGLLSLPQVAGLLAELLTLERILTRDPERRLAVWSGPSKSQHDFRSTGHALEVKATFAREGHRTSVSSVEQLNAPVGGALHLSLFKFQVAPDGDSLPKAIRRIRTMGVDPHELELLLLRSGYRSGFDDVYGAYALGILTEHTFDVEDVAFPKIVPGSFEDGHVPHGVEQISYVIDLAGALPHALSPSQLSAVYGSLAEGTTHA